MTSALFDRETLGLGSSVFCPQAVSPPQREKKYNVKSWVPMHMFQRWSKVAKFIR